MAQLSKVFEDMQKNKNTWLRARTGSQFEDNIETSLKKYGFNRIDKESDITLNGYINEIKPNVLDVMGTKILRNELTDNHHKNCFVCQPYGSQNFPDFMVFTKEYIFMIETKFSSNNGTKPVWNSNLPKYNAFYVFASFDKQDLTFFKGSNVLPQKERKKLNEFFDQTKKIENEFKNTLNQEFLNLEIELDRGFNVYVRKAFEQSQTINKNAKINYFDHPKRSRIENKVIKFIKKSEDFEK